MSNAGHIVDLGHQIDHIDHRVQPDADPDVLHTVVEPVNEETPRT